jgi:hypothetical protein
MLERERSHREASKSTLEIGKAGFSEAFARCFQELCRYRSRGMNMNEEQKKDQEATMEGKEDSGIGTRKEDRQPSVAVTPVVQVEGAEREDKTRSAPQSESLPPAPLSGHGAQPCSTEGLLNKTPTQPAPSRQKDEVSSAKEASPSKATDELWNELEVVLGNADRASFLCARCVWRPLASKTATWAMLIAKDSRFTPLASCALLNEDVIGGEELYGVMSTSSPQIAWIIIGDRVEIH